MEKPLKYVILFSIVVISVAMHYNHFSKDLMSIHVWRQTQTQSTIINFYEEDMNILNPRRNDRGNGDGVFRMEFPLMQWLVAGTYKVFGNHLIISRIFMFIIGLLSIFGIYNLLLAIFQNNRIALIDKKGWGYQDNKINAPELKSMIKNGAESLYTDSRQIDNNKEILYLLDTLILERGSIRIYSLKKTTHIITK